MNTLIAIPSYNDSEHLPGLIKRISKEVKIDTINNQEDIEGLKI